MRFSREGYVMGNKKNSYSMIMAIVSILIVFVIIKFIAPYVFMFLLAKDHTMPTPSTLMLWYMILAILGALVYVSTSDLKWAKFLVLSCRPMIRQRRYFKNNRYIISIVSRLVCLFGDNVWHGIASGAENSASYFVAGYEKLENPFANADEKTKKKICREEGKSSTNRIAVHVMAQRPMVALC